jgi:hypothetical protein
MREDILQRVGKLERVDIPEPELDMRIHNELGESQDFSAQMEGISEARFLALLGRQRLDGLQVHVVVQMQVIQVLFIDWSTPFHPGMNRRRSLLCDG